MKAVRTAAFSDLRRRKLQTLIIAFVIVLSSGAATMALSLLIETDAPYDHAFAHANGAHLTIAYDARHVTRSQLIGTGHARGVTAFAGPWRQINTDISTAPPGLGAGATIAGRSRPDAAVDRLTIESGRWARANGEIVLSQHLADDLGAGPGDRVSVGGKNGSQSLLVAGVAASVSPYTDAWVLPGELPALVSPGSVLEYQMIYRVQPSATDADLRHATQAIAGHLPPGSVVSTSNYLDVKRNADITTSVMIPFLLAFSAFALLAAVLIITNVVTGVVIAAYRDFGVMKSIGFTPGQVVLVLMFEILAPVAAGCLAGIPLGTLASQPFLQQTAHALGLPAPFTAVVPVDLLVLAGVLVATILSVLSPALRAGRMSAVDAITRGSAPRAGRASGLDSRLARLPLPRVLSLGAGDAVARPLRSATTLGAILIGATTVVFALSLHLSLQQVAAHLIRDQYAPVQVSRPPTLPPGVGKRGFQGGPAPVVPSDRQVVRLIRSNPDTARYVAEVQDSVAVPGIAEPINYYAYRGASSWLGYAMISGRWFSGPGEVVAPTKLVQEAHLQVGQEFTAYLRGRPIHLRLVGEVLDQTDQDLLLRGGWAAVAAVDPALQATDYEIQVRSGVDPQTYAYQLAQASAGTGQINALDVRTVEHSSSNTTFILFNTVIGGLAVVLISIAVAGVFNTVVLTTREKVRDVAILKAIGMAPAQVVAMVITSVAVLGVVAGALGIPAGYLLHREIIQFMGQVASDTAIPPSFFDLIDHRIYPLLALAGVAIAAVGAWIPAQWAASSRVAEVLQSE
ncbi:MAG TPA: FtsX-like permease family protein [Chloroflexota bacterium]|nr:FtsX-like permease family protein [Chloroflexota bacterium]